MNIIFIVSTPSDACKAWCLVNIFPLLNSHLPSKAVNFSAMEACELTSASWFCFPIFIFSTFSFSIFLKPILKLKNFFFLLEHFFYIYNIYAWDKQVQTSLFFSSYGQLKTVIVITVTNRYCRYSSNIHIVERQFPPFCSLSNFKRTIWFECDLNIANMVPSGISISHSRLCFSWILWKAKPYRRINMGSLGVILEDRLNELLWKICTMKTSNFSVAEHSPHRSSQMQEDETCILPVQSNDWNESIHVIHTKLPRF